MEPSSRKILAFVRKHGQITEYKLGKLLGLYKKTLPEYRKKGKIKPSTLQPPYQYGFDEVRNFLNRQWPILANNRDRAGWGQTRFSKQVPVDVSRCNHCGGKL